MKSVIFSESIRTHLGVLLVSGVLAFAVMPATAQNGQLHYVTGLDPKGDNWLALKAGPDIKSARLAKLSPDTLLISNGRRAGDWLYVKVLNGPEGWVASKYTACCRANLTKPSPTQASATKPSAANSPVPQLPKVAVTPAKPLVQPETQDQHLKRTVQALSAHFGPVGWARCTVAQLNISALIARGESDAQIKSLADNMGTILGLMRQHMLANNISDNVLGKLISTSNAQRRTGDQYLETLSQCSRDMANVGKSMR